MTRHVFLIGFMGSGKTHWGRAVAEKSGRPFVDLDSMIEEREGKSIAEIFAESEEAGFRKLERKHLQSLLNVSPSIVATGGGTPCFFDNMAWMKIHGATIYLKIPIEILAKRLKNEREQRPLLKNLGEAELRDFIQNRLLEREPFYRQADCTLEHMGDDAAFLEQLMAIAK